MNESRVRIFTQTPKKYNIMKISPPIDLKIQTWIKPMLYRDFTTSDSNTSSKINAWRKRKSHTSFNRSNKVNSPLILTERTSFGKNNNKFIGRKESFNQNSNYYILGRNDHGYEAFPVFDWFNFTRGVNFRYLNEDEAEERFKSRNTTLNLSLIMKDLQPVNREQLMQKNPLSNIQSHLFKHDQVDFGSSNEFGFYGKKVRRNMSKFRSSDSEALDELGEGEFESKELEYFSDTPNSSGTEGFRPVSLDKTSENFRDFQQNDSDPEDGIASLPKGLAENNDMFASSCSSSDDQLSSQGKSIKALISHSNYPSMGNYHNSSSESDADNLEFSSKCINLDHSVDGAFPDLSVVGTLVNENVPNILNFSSKRENYLQDLKSLQKGDAQLIEREVLKYLARGPMNSKALVRKLKRKLPEMHPEHFLRNISDIMKSCNVEKHQTKDGKVIFQLK